VCYGDPATLLVEDSHSGRYRVMGPRGRQGPGGHPGARRRREVYPVTARPTKRQELRRYGEWKAATPP